MSTQPQVGANNRRWQITAIVALVAVAALAIALFAERRSSGAVQSAALERIEQRIDAMEQGGASAAAGLPGGVKAPGVASLPGRDAQGEAAGDAPENEGARARRLDSAFAAQPPDAAAARIELSMLETMTGNLLGSSGITAGNPDVDCRRDTCRIQADFPNESEAYDWMTYYVTAVGGQFVGKADSSISRNPNGSVQARLYARRNKTGS